jgi:amidohydrolase
MLSEFRRTLHQNPELSGQEVATAAKIHQELALLTPDILLQNLGGHGLLAIFGNNPDQKTIFFRAELDALPIAEVNDFAHKSVHPQVSHKCGHDGHATILLGLAQKVASERDNIHVNVGLLFQPAEEIGKGAIAMLNDPNFEEFKPDYIFALHNLPGYPLHQIVVKDGIFTPEVKSYIFRLQGKTAHAAEPENGISPALAIAEILQGAQQISSNSPEDLALITPIHIVMGKPAYGVAAGNAEIHFTLRSYAPARMRRLENDLKELVRTSVLKRGLQLHFNSLEEFKANVNDRQAVDFVRNSARALQLDILEIEQPMKWGEDFGAFTQQFPGAIFGLGAGLDCPALHNPDYDFPDKLIETGVNTFFGIVQQLK